MKRYFFPLLMALALGACTNDKPDPTPGPEPEVTPPDGGGETPDYDPETIPSFSYMVPSYGGETASDEVSYQTGNADLNPDANKWDKVVTITYDGATARVDAPAGITHSIIGANVDLNLGQNKNVKVVATGSSTQGSLRLSGYYKHLLELKDLTLSSTDRPAINDQIKKRVFVVLTGVNKLEDGATYAASSEDRKGCFFAEDHVILCGSGTLQIKGNNRHGLATDGFLFVNPGATLAVTDAAKNAIHVKGAGVNNNYRGVEILGGYIYARTSAPSGKALKTDGYVKIYGGSINLYATGDAAIDPEDGLFSSPGCMKSAMDVTITGGTINLCATGLGAKGVSTDGNLLINGSTLTAALSGSSTSQNGDNSTPKTLNAHGAITISAGGIYLSATGNGASAIDSDVALKISNGVVYAFGKNYGLKAQTAEISGGTILCGGAQNATIDGVETMSLSDIEADHVTVIKGEDGATAAAFRWPTDLQAASLLYKL